MSDLRSVSNESPSRFDMMVMPWSPIVPLTSTRSPGRARSPLGTVMPWGTTPTPEVLMNTPSPLPRSTTLVSPVTIGTPAARAAFAIESTIFFRSARGKPSSRMKPAESAIGFAPAIARSFTVPCTARQPMSPPGKKRGLTT